MQTNDLLFLLRRDTRASLWKFVDFVVSFLCIKFHALFAGREVPLFQKINNSESTRFTLSSG
jgi:hypothetical protein